MKKRILLLLFIFFVYKPILCTSETTLAAMALTKVFDPTTGTLFLGLDGGDEKAISRINRFAGVTTPTVTGIATKSDPSLNDESIEFLALATQQCQTKPNLAVVTNSGNSFEQTKVIAVSYDGTTATETDALNDHAENTTGGIVELAANTDHIFAAVRPNGGDFGDANSGIALITLNPTLLTQTIQDATSGTDGNKAQLFDKTSEFIKIGGDFTFNTLGTAGTNRSIKLHWDEKLQRLYIGVNVLSGATTDTDGVRSVAMAKLETAGTLTIDHFVPNDVFENNANNIIGLKTHNSYAFVRHLLTMHTSTGPSYLIVNGSVGPGNNEPINNIYALPLIDNQSSADHGKLASKASTIINGKFTQIADENDDLLNTTITADFAAALVGGSPLPMPENFLPSDIVVVGDTVYASIEEQQQFDDGTPEDSSEAGIFYSQALFDENGKIIRWTPWSKRAFPFDGFASITTDTEKGKIKFFAVDALNGRLWGVDGSQKIYLASTAWTLGNANDQTTLTYNLNNTLCDGCFSVLDLDQSTRGLGVSSPGRYTLFGGKGKVVFAKTTRSMQTTTDFSVSSGTIPAPQTVVDDFSSATNFLATTLPSDSSAVVSLEYSRRLNASNSQNYFFAGTQKGLYVFADSLQEGFTVDHNVDDLNAAPFDGQWHKFDNIEGSVIALKTSGRESNTASDGALYVLTMQTGTTAQWPLIFKIYRINFATQINNMTTYLLAQSGVEVTDSDLSDIKTIFGMELISTVIGANTKEQLVIATNRGLYRSTALEATNAQNGIIDATNQSTAKWQPINTDDTAMYSNIFGIDNAVNPTTIWPVRVDDKKGVINFTRSSIRQLNGTEIANDYLFVPEQFNATCQHQPFLSLPKTTFFWSDGARRFFIVKSEEWYAGPSNRLLVLPFNVSDWHVCNLNTVLSDPALRGICTFYWIKQIGATGQLMVGTNNGVVTLN